MTDVADKTLPAATPPNNVGAALRLFGALLLVIFGAGIATGALAAAREHGDFGLGGAIGIALALLVIGAGGWLAFSARGRVLLPRSPRVRRSRIALYLSLGVSLIVGAVAGMTGQIASEMPGDATAVYSLLLGSHPIAASIAVLGLAGWTIALIVSIYWHRSLDEIERAEYEFGGIVALYVYLFVAPAWWLAWRGGMMPQPDNIAIFGLVCIVWCIGWGWRRYR